MDRDRVRDAARRELARRAPDLADDERDRIVDTTADAIAKQAAAGKIRKSAAAAACVYAWGLARRYLVREKRRREKLATEAAATLERQRMADPMAELEAKLDMEKLAGQKVRRRPRVGETRYSDLADLKAAVIAHAWTGVRKKLGDLRYADVNLGMFAVRDAARAAALPGVRAERRRSRRRGAPPPEGEVNDPADRRGGLMGLLDEWRDVEGLAPRDLALLSLLAGLWPGRVTRARLRRTPASVLEAVREQETNVRAALAAEARRLAKLEADPRLRWIVEQLAAAIAERSGGGT